MADSHRAKLMQPEPEAGYDTEIPTATANAPKKLRIDCCIDPVHAAVGRYDLDPDQAVDRQPVGAADAAHAT
ncbi:MAG: hypothetical protein EOR04_32630, partial [Mesorhizobium sp.]|uniref:hypothetical protein n=1 Tax=Mesorhizobium sp. TaxID=1871066 RepID=UPI000FE46D1D